MSPRKLSSIARALSESLAALSAVRPHRRRGVGLAGFLFRLETEDGVPAEPWQLTSVVPYWGAGDTIHLGKRTLRVIGKRDDDVDQPPALIVEDESAT